MKSENCAKCLQQCKRSWQIYNIVKALLNARPFLLPTNHRFLCYGCKRDKYMNVMQDRNVIAGATAAVISPLVDFYAKLLPFLMLAMLLIIIDSRFGIQASKKRGETIRTSRAIRRAINKLVDYICWITLAGMIGNTFGSAFHIPLLSIIVLCVVYSIELTSIFNNYFFYKGIKKKFNGLKFFSKLTGHTVIEESIENIEDGKDSDR